jgi:hypothetical protein
MTYNRRGNAGKTVGDAHNAAHTFCHDEKADANSRIALSREILTDALGVSYQSVRFCDLDRFCDK